MSEAAVSPAVIQISAWTGPLSRRPNASSASTTAASTICDTVLALLTAMGFIGVG